MPSRWDRRLLIAGVRLLPKNLLSRAAGRATAWKLPAALQRLEIRAFAAAVGADLSEAADPLDSFTSMQEFFTRRLGDGVRPIDAAPEALVAPCDGLWGTAGKIDAGVLLQVKGQPYSLAALLGSAAAAQRFEGGAYATFYLSPRDYHRFHAPCSLRVLRATHLPGALWPVNRAGVEGVPGLFAQNERICAYAAVGSEERERLCLVAVGATLVGKVRVQFDAELTTNARAGEPLSHAYGAEGIAFAKGRELGRFEFGSTIVMLTATGLGEIEAQPSGSRLRLGTRIGTLRG